MNTFQIGSTVTVRTAYEGNLGYAVITQQIEKDIYEVWVYRVNNQPIGYYTVVHEKTLTAHNPYQAN